MKKIPWFSMFFTAGGVFFETMIYSAVAAIMSRVLLIVFGVEFKSLIAIVLWGFLTYVLYSLRKYLPFVEILYQLVKSNDLVMTILNFVLGFAAFFVLIALGFYSVNELEVLRYYIYVAVFGWIFFFANLFLVVVTGEL